MKSDASVVRPYILLIGDFLPPVTGAAKNNKIVADRFDERFDVEQVNTAATSSSLNRQFSYHFIRVVRNLRAASRIVAKAMFDRRRTIVYHVPNAGLGAVYTVLFAVLAKVFSMSCVLHHRSFRYIDQAKSSMRLVVHLIGKHGLHLFLSDGMEQAFRNGYGNRFSASVISNAAYVDVTQGHQRASEGRLVIGHLSNLCREKGVYDVTETFRRLRRDRDDIDLLIGGPAMDSDVERELADLKAEYGDDVSITGKINADEKNGFYAQIDLFLFPTRYAVEAQPNVVFEALASGCVVAAFDRGCIAEMLPEESLLVDSKGDFAEAVAHWVSEFSANNALAELSAASLRHSDEQRKIGLAQLAEALGMIQASIEGRV